MDGTTNYEIRTAATKKSNFFLFELWETRGNGRVCYLRARRNEQNVNVERMPKMISRQDINDLNEWAQLKL